MPILDGNESVKLILEYEKEIGLNHTPVSALTANVIKGAKEKGLKAGYDSFLGKPIVIKELEKVFSKYLEIDTNISTKTIESDEESSVVGLDVKALSQELMLSVDEVNTLVKMFLNKMKKVLPELENAINTKNYKQISINAHSIKGSSANFRIEFLQETAKEIEQMAKDENSEFNYEEAHAKMNEYMKGIEVN